jgi:hypothetical protein
MKQLLSTPLARRSAIVGLALTAAPVTLAGADRAYAQAKQAAPETKPENSLYERLGGVFAIAAVVDHFSDAARPGGGAPGPSDLPRGIRCGGRGTRTDPGLLQGSEAREGRSPGRLRRP